MHISCSPQETNIEKGYDHETGSTYVPKATSSSSQRIQAGYMKAQTQPNSCRTGANQRRRKMRKYASHQRLYQQCRRAPEELFRDFDPKSKDCYVFDGSKDSNQPTPNRPDHIPRELWKPLSIAGGDLMVVDTSNVYLGTQYLKPTKKNNPHNCPPPFMMPPRVDVLNSTDLKDDATLQTVSLRLHRR
jgi:hypothetical protein